MSQTRELERELNGITTLNYESNVKVIFVFVIHVVNPFIWIKG